VKHRGGEAFFVLFVTSREKEIRRRLIYECSNETGRSFGGADESSRVDLTREDIFEGVRNLVGLDEVEERE
jgi:hypothetical protein